MIYFLTMIHIVYVKQTPSLMANLYSLTLANSMSWKLYPTDIESEKVVNRLAQVMNLDPGESEETIYISVKNKRADPPPVACSGTPAICILPLGENQALETMQMSALSHFIVLQALPFGAVLVHGALIAKDEKGVILAAPGGTGKTTASSRVGGCWVQMSDDATLVVKDNDGVFHAHPWPTWSRFFDNGPGGNWSVENAVELSGIFFLSRADENAVTPISKGEATGLLTESIYQVMVPMYRDRRDKKENEKICSMQLNIASSIIEKIPAYTLHISLTGPFWEEIDKVLEITNSSQDECIQNSACSLSITEDNKEIPNFCDGTIPVVYSGPSMNPTLVEPGLLKVRPYKKEILKVGDVICFHSAIQNHNIVHRIIRITPHGLVTRGDNNLQSDPDLVKEEQIIGKVLSAWTEMGPRKIPGGITGYWTHLFLLIYKRSRIVLFWILLIFRPLFLTCKKKMHDISIRINPEIVVFSHHQRKVCKLFYKGKLIGKYDLRNKNWSIAFPYWLLVDRYQLPNIMTQIRRYEEKKVP